MGELASPTSEDAQLDGAVIASKKEALLPD